jgi:putative ABC transport system ATP-binding protein
MRENQDLTPSLLLEVRGLVKDHQSLRPLRVRELSVPAGEVVSVAGMDGPAAEMFVHLVTGAALPDEGEIALFGRNTRDVQDADGWLRSLDGLGLVSGRAVLLDMLSVLQNVALPLTLDVDPIAADLLGTVESLAREAGIDPAAWNQPLGAVTPETRLRVHVARAVASGPRIVVAEHPSAGLPRDVVARVAQDVGRLARARGLALVVLTADAEFARALGGRRLGLAPRTGELSETVGMTERFRRLFER